MAVDASIFGVRKLVGASNDVRGQPRGLAGATLCARTSWAGAWTSAHPTIMFDAWGYGDSLLYLTPPIEVQSQINYPRGLRPGMGRDRLVPAALECRYAAKRLILGLDRSDRAQDRARRGAAGPGQIHRGLLDPAIGQRGKRHDEDNRQDHGGQHGLIRRAQ